MNKTFFFDSYAIAEILLGNKSYEPYAKSNIFLTKLNIFEMHYCLTRDVGEKEAEDFLEKYYPFIIDFNKEDIRVASKLKLKHKKRNLSMTDCIGYVVARRLGIKFLTGDKEFRGFENVEFVK